MLRPTPAITTIPQPTCLVCGATGVTLYHSLSDRLCGIDGEWNLRRCLDQRCGLVWLDPMPAETELEKLYSNYSIHGDTEPLTSSMILKLLTEVKDAYCSARYGYSAEKRWSSALRHVAYLLPGYRAQWDFSVFYLSALPQGRLLDIGCGTGKMMKRMADLGWQAQGIDFAPKAVEVAKAQGLNVQLGSLDEQRFEDNSFDAVVMSHVIEHVADPRSLLESCKRILKPGGQLASITPNASSWGHQVYGRNWYGLDPPRHLHIFTTQSMRRLAEEAEFGDSHVTSVVANAHGVLWSSKQLEKRDRALVENYTTREALWSRIMQKAEWLRLRRYPDAGEEILLYAIK